MTTWEQLQKWRNISLAIFILSFPCGKIEWIPAYVHDLLFIAGLVSALIPSIILFKHEKKYRFLSLGLIILCSLLIILRLWKLF